MPNVKKSQEEFRKRAYVFTLFQKRRKRFKANNRKRQTAYRGSFLQRPYCLTFRLIMLQTSQGDKSRTILVFQYSRLKDLIPATRSLPLCDCLVCKMGRSTPFSNREYYVPSLSPARPSTGQNSQPIKLCPDSNRTWQDLYLQHVSSIW